MLTAIFGPQLLKFIIDWGTTGLMFGIFCGQLMTRQRICGQSLAAFRVGQSPFYR